MDTNFNKIIKIKKYQSAHLKECLSLFRTNMPVFFAKNEVLLFKEYLQKKNIHYYLLFKEEKIIASGGFGFNKEEKTIDLTWGMVNSHMHKKGYGKKLLNYRIKKIAKDFPNTNINLNTSQKTFKFYENFDFQVEKITKNFYRTGLDRYDMVKIM